MSKHIQDYIVKSTQKDWSPLVEKGIDTKGIYVKSLRNDTEKKRSSTFLLKFESGAFYPYHNHPAGEELFVIEGSCIIEGTILSKGDYLYTPANYKHSVKTETGCVLFFIVPEEVEILHG